MISFGFNNATSHSVSQSVGYMARSNDDDHVERFLKPQSKKDPAHMAATTIKVRIVTKKRVQ